MKIRMYMTKALTAVLILTQFACSDDDSAMDENILEQEEVVALMANALEAESGGSMETLIELTIAIEVTVNGEAVCNTTYDNAIDYSYDQLGVTASYTGDWSYRFNCDASQTPSSASYSYAKTVTATAPRVTTNGTTGMNGSIDGLSPEIPTYSLNGSYEGESVSELVSAGKKIQSSLRMDLNGLTIDKETDAITGGQASFTFSGLSNGSSFSYKGNMEFKPDGSIEVTIDGTVHIIA